PGDRRRWRERSDGSAGGSRPASRCPAAPARRSWPSTPPERGSAEPGAELHGQPCCTSHRGGLCVRGGGRARAVRPVSVVISTYSQGRAALLLDAVSSVRRQTVQPLAVIVIVDHN